MFDRGRLQAGQTFLCSGTSGIGVTAIRWRGRRRHRDRNRRQRREGGRCTTLGAHHAINYREQDLSPKRRITGGKGVDVILDMVAALIARELKCMPRTAAS